MTILIKGVEMPKEGSVLVIDSCGEVWSNTWPTRGYIRVDKAKAVEVPTPHGRLIDADELPLHDEFILDGMAIDVVFNSEIEQAPTIIEAEEVIR